MNHHKILIAYFSRPDENYNIGTVKTGNNEILAENVAKILAKDGIKVDTFKIDPVVPYPKDYEDCVTQATIEKEQAARPKYNGDIANWEEYDMILIGYPIWWGDLPMIVYSFLEDHDFTGKTVIPFNTHEGSGNAGTFTKIKNLLKGANVTGDGWNTTGVKSREESSARELAELVKR